ncbi:MAG: hypothetical protein A2W05_07340 [Candidatus Schekmanbacteria bacterium RBG_16_38_10]|uniref:Uncharacterized protein n=1 Tax=Candidatus Schekmanbacteria bacterium RBG_16_38_10 TaxID=1817879 RepID=A0A1F7S0Q1_9BACT|nr:MAG: hypothetical protein A2W05_07340 [Candidatus Schekmanbacteria bacterium RBG_16_38_10]
MKKEKKNKDFKFNHADYDYLDKASLEDYISEFLWRNDEFIKFCIKLYHYQKNDKEYRLNIYNVRAELFNKFKIYPYAVPLLNKDKMAEFNNAKRPKVGLPPPVTAYRIFSGENDENKIKSKKLSEKIKKYLEQDDWISALWCNHHLGKIHADDDVEGILEALFGNTGNDRYYAIGDTLLLAIHLDSTKEEIEKDIQKILSIHKQRRKGSQRPDKWKYYLIVYDLRKQDMSYETIEEILSNAYEEKEDVFDIENLKNYYKNALELINGGYKRYI